MAYLIEVFRVDDHPALKRRQSLLVIEDQLTIIMDLSKLDLVNEHVLLKNKDLEDFIKKYNFLSQRELKNAFKITLKDVINILGESVPCVGCRRKVERLCYQLMAFGEMALDPLQVKPDGTLVIKEEIISVPRTLCSIFADHSERLSHLVNNQPRIKKSRRCVLHSLDLHKSRPVTPPWKDVWLVMHEKCKAEVLLIDFTTLLLKLENYLKKHRFCADCRTKVMKAYNLLTDDCDPTKEKGYTPSLYQKIKRCPPGKHIHLPNETEYIDSLITRAEPELMGSRRERHAKTMEIAQEEVLTCIGICIYDRFRRIYVRLQEEEFTCRVLAAITIEALCRNFETAVEKKRGITQLELLCEEITKKELAKQQKKETKKLKRRRKKEKRSEMETNEKLSFECGTEEFVNHSEEENYCACPNEKSKKYDRHKREILDRECKVQSKCFCEDCYIKDAYQSVNQETSHSSMSVNKFIKEKKFKINIKGDVLNKNKFGDIEQSGVGENNNTVDCHKDKKNSTTDQCQSCQSVQGTIKFKKRKSINKQRMQNGYSQDCRYSSENNNGCFTISPPIYSVHTSPEGSEVICSKGFCDQDGLCNSDRNMDGVKRKNLKSKAHFSLLLEEMLEKASLMTDDDDCFIPIEEIQAFKAKMPLVDEKRYQLRQTLKNRFAQLCIKSQIANA